MDAVQFGRWLSTRRRKCGYRSQRVLVEKAHTHPLLCDMAISEDFLARLEAGQLAHPFRGRVRERVLGLAWLLCKTARDAKNYLRAAELTELTSGESELLHLLNEEVAIQARQAQHVITALPMPPRPPRIPGRTGVLQEVINTLYTTETGLCMITGMPGVGKSALAYEAVHLVAANETGRTRMFPGGIAAFTCTGRRGTSGLVDLLHDIARAFGDPSYMQNPGVQPDTGPDPHKGGHYILEPRTEENIVTPLVGVRLGGVRRGVRPTDEAEETDANNIAQMIDRVRMALANRSVLLLLDDVEADFPWRLALDALLGQRQSFGQPGQGLSSGQEQSSGQAGQFGRGRAEASAAPTSRVVLATSRYVPAPALMRFHCRLTPLEPDDALELFQQLVGRSSLPVEEQKSAEQICAAVGYLPLAIEIAAAAASVEGIPLPLLAASATQHPLDELFDGQHELRSRMIQALAPLEPELRRQFALLSTLGVQSFGLESVAAMRAPALHTQRTQRAFATWLEEDESDEVIHSHVSKRDRYRLSLEPDLSISREHLQKQMQVPALDTLDVPLEQLARTAAELGQLVRHSLLDLEPHGTSIVPRSSNLLKSNTVRYTMHPVLRAQAVGYLRQLEPVIVEEAMRNTQAYALSYIDRHRWDATQLERERDFLFASLEQARRAEQHAQVIRFVEGLVILTCRLCNHEEGERVIQWGIHASQELHDRKYQIYFLHDLGNFLTMAGQFNRARQAFQEALELAPQVKQANAWFPLCGLAHIAHIQGEYDTALDFSENYLRHCRESSDTRSVVVALHLHSFYARLNGKIDQAYADTSQGLQLLTEKLTGSTGADRLQLHVQAEFARVQGHYTQSRDYIETLANIIEEKCDLYMLADTLFDQACYAQQQGQHEDVRNLAQRVIQVATHIGSPHFQSRSIQLLQQLPPDPHKGGHYISQVR